MIEEQINRRNNETNSNNSGSLSSKRRFKQHGSPISPLSPESRSCGSIELTIDDAVDDSIEKLYQNICDMESSDESQSMRSFTTYGNESRIDSELRHLVGASNGKEEDIKEVVVVQHHDTVQKKLPQRKSAGKVVKGIPSKVVGKTNNVKNTSQKPPVAKNNVVRGSRRTLSGSFQFDEKSLTSDQENVKKVRSSPDLGPYLLKKARDVISSGDNPKKAFDLAIRAKNSFEECVYDKPNLDFVMCLHLLASMHCSAGQHMEAIPLLERAIQIPNIEIGKNHSLAKFVGCMQLGDIYAVLGQIEKSITLYKEGLEVQKNALGDQDLRVAETCRYVAEAYVQAFEFGEAENFCQMALEIRKANGTPLSIEEAADRRLMGLIYESKENYEGSLEHYVLASMAMRSSGQDSDVASVDCNIGDAYLVLARYDEAVSSYKKALAAFKSSKGKNHPAVASVFVRLAELYNKIGKFGESKSHCEKALQIYSKPAPNSNMEDVANGLTDLAAIYESMNELGEALNLLNKALGLYSNEQGHKSTIAGIEAQVGVIYYMLGNYSDCYHYFKSSIAKFEDSTEKKSSLYGITLNQLGLACVQLCEISEAAELFEESKSILEREYGSHHPDTLGVYSNLAGAYDALGRWDDAISLLEYVVLTREEKLGTADPVVDDEKCRLAELLKEAGKARRRRSRSLKVLLDNNPLTTTKTVTRLM